MAWTTPPTFVALATLTAANMVIMTGNDTYLYNGRPLAFVQRNANYSSTAVAWTDIDAVNLIITATLGGTRARLDAAIYVSSSSAGLQVYLNAIMDSATYPANQNATYGMSSIAAGSNGAFSPFSAIWTGLTPGSHTFKLQWKLSAAGTMYAGSLGTIGGSVWLQNIYMTLYEY